MIKKKRSVSKNLWRTQHKNADYIYKEISNTQGRFKKCPFYKWKKIPPVWQTNHNEINTKYDSEMVPIEEFDFQMKKDWTWGLQSYCKMCYKVYRQMRIKNSRKVFEKMSIEEIYSWYIENVWKSMICSKCKEDLEPVNFRASPWMEKWLHNICYDCEWWSWDSVREKEWLSDWDWTSWKDKVIEMRHKKEVKCSWWPQSVKLWYCLWVQSWRDMHADHIVPLRAWWIHDWQNFQPLCKTCNSKKSSQLDSYISIENIKKLSSKKYHYAISENDSNSTIERKMKQALVEYISNLYKSNSYKKMLILKKKEVNWQWNIERFYKKWTDWIKKQTNFN